MKATGAVTTAATMSTVIIALCHPIVRGCLRGHPCLDGLLAASSALLITRIALGIICACFARRVLVLLTARLQLPLFFFFDRIMRFGHHSLLGNCHRASRYASITIAIVMRWTAMKIPTLLTIALAPIGCRKNCCVCRMFLGDNRVEKVRAQR